MMEGRPARPESRHFRLHGGPAPTRQKAMSSSGEILTADGKSPKSGGAAAVELGIAPRSGEGSDRHPGGETEPASLRAGGARRRRGGRGPLLPARAQLRGDRRRADRRRTSATSGPRVTGTVTAVYVVENQRVKAGDVPRWRSTPPTLQVAVAQAKASGGAGRGAAAGRGSRRCRSPRRPTRAGGRSLVGARCRPGRPRRRGEGRRAAEAQLAQAEANDEAGPAREEARRRSHRKAGDPARRARSRIATAETSAAEVEARAARAGGGARAGRRSRRRRSAPPRAS